MAVCYLVVVIISSGGCTTINVPSGPNSTLDRYLCGGSDLLSSGNSLQLEAGEHVISGGPFCSISYLQDIAITEAGRDLTVVRCNGGQRFHFLFVSNLAIANIAFVGCGQDITLSIPYVMTGIDLESEIITPSVSSVILRTSLTLHMEFSSVSIQYVTMSNFSGLGIYGFAMDKAVLKEIQFLNCAACAGAAFYGARILTVQGCLFENMTYLNSSNIGSGLSIWESYARINDCVFYNHASVIGAILVLSSIAEITNDTFVSLNGGALRVFYSYINIQISTFSGNYVGDSGGAIYLAHNHLTLLSGCRFKNNVAGLWGGAIQSLIVCSLTTLQLLVEPFLSLIRANFQM